MRKSEQGKSKPRRRLGAAVSATLVVYLASWFSLLPLFQVVHLNLAGHEHRYCADHDQFEDVQHDSTAGRVDGHAIAGGGAADAASLRTASGPSPQRHVACSVLNIVTTRDPLLLAGQPALTVHQDQRHTLALSRQPEFIPSPLLLSAPKTSPPRSAA